MTDTYAADDYASIAGHLRALETAKRGATLQAPGSVPHIKWAIWCKTDRWEGWLRLSDGKNGYGKRYSRTETPNTYETYVEADTAITARRSQQPHNTYSVKEFPGQ